MVLKGNIKWKIWMNSLHSNMQRWYMCPFWIPASSRFIERITRLGTGSIVSWWSEEQNGKGREKEFTSRWEAEWKGRLGKVISHNEGIQADNNLKNGGNREKGWHLNLTLIWAGRKEEKRKEGRREKETERDFDTKMHFQRGPTTSEDDVLTYAWIGFK